LARQNFNKIRRFLLNQDEFGTNCAANKDIKLSVDTVFKSLNIGRYRWTAMSIGL